MKQLVAAEPITEGQRIFIDQHGLVRGVNMADFIAFFKNGFGYAFMTNGLGKALVAAHTGQPVLVELDEETK